VLDPVAPVGGVVVDGEGRPVAGAWIHATTRGQEPEAAGTDREGRFLLARTVAGRWSIHAQEMAPAAGSTARRSGNAEAEGGDREVRIVVGDPRDGR
jgi:hypothetical protein